MGRPPKKRPQPVPKTPLEAFLLEYLNWMQVKNYSPYTTRNRRIHLEFFLAWCGERGLVEPSEITRPVLERYQLFLFYYRKKNGQPLSVRTQHACLVPLRTWFRWMARENYILHNPAADLELPRIGYRLPKHVLTAAEAEQVLAQPDVREPLGLRDRALLETLYSTGMRRMELIHLQLYDLDLDRGAVVIRQGKGRKDRTVPIGERAVAWVEKYLAEARPRLVVEPDPGNLFLTAEGEPFSLDHMTFTVRNHVAAAKLHKMGACHLFRHTMATLMLEGGADIRFIQEMLGHTKLSTTQMYTQVSIRMLKQIHTATHPAARLQKTESSKTAAKEENSPERAELVATLEAEAAEENE
jgi:integrase/recombinase XerD